MHAHDLPRISTLPTAPANEPSDGPATVLSRAGAELQLKLEGHQVSARRASSCLFEPAPGDRVWCVGVGDERYVLAVLVRASERGSVLRVDGDLELVAGGRVRVSATKGIELTTEATLRVGAGELELEATRARLVFEELRTIIRSIVASFVHATQLGGALELIVDRVTQRSQQVQRSVEGVELSEAGTLIQRTRGAAHLQAKQALINGTQLTKIDGQQVQLG